MLMVRLPVLEAEAQRGNLSTMCRHSSDEGANKTLTQHCPCPYKAHSVGICHFVESQWQHGVEIQRLTFTQELREPRGRNWAGDL